MDATTVGEILLALDDDKHTLSAVPQAIYSAPLDSHLTDAAVRLLEALLSPKDRCFLGPMIVRLRRDVFPFLSENLLFFIDEILLIRNHSLFGG